MLFWWQFLLTIYYNLLQYYLLENQQILDPQAPPRENKEVKNALNKIYKMK